MRVRFGQRGLRVTPPRVLAAALLAVLVTVALLAHDETPNVFRAIALVGHVGLGLVVVPLALLALYELYKRRVGAFPIGHALVLVSGAAVLIVGGARTHADVLAAHAAIGAAFAVWSLVPRRAAFLGAPLAFLVAHDVVSTRAVAVPGTVEPVDRIADDARPSGALVIDVAALSPTDAARFLDETRCLACHRSIDPARHVGGHGHAPTFADARLSEASCASCHDPAREVRAIATPAPREVSTWPCLACHGGAELAFADDAARFTLSLPRDPVVTNDGVFLTFARALTRTDARAHRARMRSKTTRATLSCTACHTTNAHREAPVSRGVWPLDAAGPASLHRGPARLCVDCHSNATPPPAVVVAAFARSGAEKPLSLTVDDTPATTQTLTLLLTNENAGHGFPASPFASPARVHVRRGDVEESILLTTRSPATRVLDEHAVAFDAPIPPGLGALIDVAMETAVDPRDLVVEVTLSSRVDPARGVLHRALVEQTPSPVLLARLVVALIDADRADEARSALAVAERRAPDDLDVKRARAHLLVAIGAPDDARALLQNEGDPEVRVVRALLGDGREASDVRAIDDAHRRAPFDVELTLARVSRGLSPDDARRALTRALAAHPGEPSLLAALDALPQ